MADMFEAGGDRSPLRYRTLWQPDRPVRGQPTRLGVVEHDLALMAPVWKSGSDRITLSAGLRTDSFHTAAVLPESGQPFLDELWNVRLGTNCSHRFGNGWTAGSGVNVGSASNRPFDQLRDIKVGAMVFLRIPWGEGNAWNFGLNYAPLSDIPFPIPNISYLWQPSDGLRMNIGLPFRVIYRPWDDLTLDFSMLLRTVHGQATYRPSERWRMYAAFDLKGQSWFLHDRLNDKERLSSYDKRLTVGVQTTLMGHVSLAVSAGYLFDRFYFTGENFFDTPHDRVEIDNGLFLSLQAGLRW